MILKVFTEKNLEEWRKILHSFPTQNYSIFHSPDYVVSWKNYEDAEIICLYLEIEGYRFLYPFLKREIKGYSDVNSCFDTTSVYGYGSMVSNSSVIDDKVIEQINKAIDEWCCKEQIVAEFIREYPVNRYLRKTEKRHVRNNLFFDYNNQRDNFSALIKKRARRDAKAAVKKGCIAEIDNDLESIYTFYKIYLSFCEEKKLDNFYYFSPAYIEDIRRYLIQYGFIVNIKYNDKIIASSLNFKYHDTITYHLSASYKQFSHLLPNDLMLYTILELGSKERCNTVFLGGGLSSAPDDGLFSFKEKYSTNSCEVHIGTKVHNQKMYDHLCRIWTSNNPDKSKRYNNYFLKYRL